MIDWGESKTKAQEWWTFEPYAKMIGDSNQAHLWLCHCAYNRVTGRWHVPMKKHGKIWTFLHDQIRKRESGIVYCLNAGFKEKRGGFFDTAWTDKLPDFWFVCDEYLEAPEDFFGTSTPMSRAHCPEDTRILGSQNSLIFFDEGKPNQKPRPFEMAQDA